MSSSGGGKPVDGGGVEALSYKVFLNIIAGDLRMNMTIDHTRESIFWKGVAVELDVLSTKVRSQCSEISGSGDGDADSKSAGFGRGVLNRFAITVFGNSDPLGGVV